MAPRELFLLLKGFGSLQSSAVLSYPSHLEPGPINEYLVTHLIENPHFKTCPPSAQYQRSFWKWIISNLERHIGDSDVEVAQEIYDVYVSLVSSDRGLTYGSAGPLGNPNAHPPDSYITYLWSSPEDLLDPRDCHHVTLLESQTMIQDGTTGLRTWPASFVLAEYMMSNPVLYHKRKIVELGSGIGFLGILLAGLQVSSALEGDSSICLTDVNETVISRCRQNSSLPCNVSHTHKNMTFRLLDWSYALDSHSKARVISFADEVDPDLIIGADIVFDPSLIPSLTTTVSMLLCSNNSRIRHALLALTIRNEQTIDHFLASLRGQNLFVEELQFDYSNGALFKGFVLGPDSDTTVKIYKITASDN